MKQSTEFELFTQYVYQKLVNNDVLKPTQVQHDVKLKGKSGCEHQIDVYWEYEIAGNKHRVAIECKNYNSLVPIGKVRDFKAVLDDLNNVNGIMVSKKGFQEGAKKFAKEYGISLRELRTPRWNEEIGSISITFYTDLQRVYFRLDDDWARNNNVDIQQLRKFYERLLPYEREGWNNAVHFPLERRSSNIYNSEGKQISSIDKLREQIPEDVEPDSSIVFPFEDGWIDTKFWGMAKIKEVKFVFQRDIHESTLTLAADDFVAAILDDAINGEVQYVPKY